MTNNTSLSDHLRRAARARWAKTTKEERSAYAKKMVEAREAKRRSLPAADPNRPPGAGPSP
jgi:hypothetical protein